MSKRTNSKILTKKAQGVSLEFFVLIVLLLVGTVFGLVLVNQYKNSAEERGPIEECRSSFTSKSLASFGITQFDENINVFNDLVTEQVELVCPTTQLIINSNDPDEIKRDIAEEMVKCWYKLGEAEHDLFKVAPTQDETNFCIYCSEIEFDENVEPQNIPGFGRFLFEEKMIFGPVQLGNRNKTYFQYFTGFGDNELRNVPAPDFTTDSRAYISTEKDYLTLVVVTKQGFLDELEPSLIAGATSIAVGSVMVFIPGFNTAGAGIATTGTVGIVTSVATGLRTSKPADINLMLVEDNPSELRRYGCDYSPLSQNLRGESRDR